MSVLLRSVCNPQVYYVDQQAHAIVLPRKSVYRQHYVITVTHSIRHGPLRPIVVGHLIPATDQANAVQVPPARASVACSTSAPSGIPVVHPPYLTIRHIHKDGPCSLQGQASGRAQTILTVEEKRKNNLNAIYHPRKAWNP